MKVDLDNLYWYQARDLLDYCKEKGIDLAQCEYLQGAWHRPFREAEDTKPWVLDIPEDHITWLTLKGLL